MRSIRPSQLVYLLPYCAIDSEWTVGYVHLRCKLVFLQSNVMVGNLDVRFQCMSMKLSHSIAVMVEGPLLQEEALIKSSLQYPDVAQNVKGVSSPEDHRDISHSFLQQHPESTKWCGIPIGTEVPLPFTALQSA